MVYLWWRIGDPAQYYTDLYHYLYLDLDVLYNFCPEGKTQYYTNVSIVSVLYRFHYCIWT